MEFFRSGFGLVEQAFPPAKAVAVARPRGTRIIPDCIVKSLDMGGSIEDIHQDWPSLSVAQIKRLIEFVHTHREQPKP